MPKQQTWDIYLPHFRMATPEELRRQFHDDFRWLGAGTYKHPQGKPVFNMQRTGPSHGADGVFAHCESVQEVDDFEWPDPDYLDFTETLGRLRQAGDFYRASGFWSPFFHDVANFFGMENYFVKMYTHPEVVHAVTRHVVDYYVEANRRFFSAAGDEVDAFFFGNDFGTQLDLFISPAMFQEFVYPYFRRLVTLAHQHQLKVILHSCGSIYKVIPNLIGLGVDALHPLQARAAHMDAETLAREFHGKIAFVGGIDTQDLLVNASPDRVKEEVRRVRTLLGPGLIVSPSHEAVLPNVPPENIAAMAEAAVE